jgi:hypothetical protein
MGCGSSKTVPQEALEVNKEADPSVPPQEDDPKIKKKLEELDTYEVSYLLVEVRNVQCARDDAGGGDVSLSTTVLPPSSAACHCHSLPHPLRPSPSQYLHTCSEDLYNSWQQRVLRCSLIPFLAATLRPAAASPRLLRRSSPLHHRPHVYRSSS